MGRFVRFSKALAGTFAVYRNNLSYGFLAREHHVPVPPHHYDRHSHKDPSIIGLSTIGAWTWSGRTTYGGTYTGSGAAFTGGGTFNLCVGCTFINPDTLVGTIDYGGLSPDASSLSGGAGNAGSSESPVGPTNAKQTDAYAAMTAGEIKNSPPSLFRDTAVGRFVGKIGNFPPLADLYGAGYGGLPEGTGVNPLTGNVVNISNDERAVGYAALGALGMRVAAARNAQYIHSLNALDDLVIPYLGRRNSPAVGIGAVDAMTGRVTAATSGAIPSKIADVLRQAARKLGGVGKRTSCGNVVGRCAEFRAANELMLKNPKMKLGDVKFTPGVRPRTGRYKGRCDNCVRMFGPE